MDCTFQLRIDGGESLGLHEGTEKLAMQQFFNLIKQMDCNYRTIILTIKPNGDSKEYTRAVAHSDGKKD